MAERRPDAVLLARIRSNSTTVNHALALICSCVEHDAVAEFGPIQIERDLLIAELIGGHDPLVMKCVVLARAGSLTVGQIDSWVYKRARGEAGLPDCGRESKEPPHG